MELVFGHNCVKTADNIELRHVGTRVYDIEGEEFRIGGVFGEDNKNVSLYSWTGIFSHTASGHHCYFYLNNALNAHLKDLNKKRDELNSRMAVLSEEIEKVKTKIEMI